MYISQRRHQLGQQVSRWFVTGQIVVYIPPGVFRSNALYMSAATIPDVLLAAFAFVNATSAIVSLGFYQ